MFKRIKTYLYIIFILIFLLNLRVVIPKNNSFSKIKYSYEKDYRYLKLQKVLTKYDSPLVPYTAYFIQEADLQNIDWRLIPAITGVESTFGKHIPINSFNAYGWNNGYTKFNDWNSSIKLVSKSLSDNYIKKGANTIDEIGYIYNPVTPEKWIGHVRYFIDIIDNTPPYINEILDLSVEI